MGLDEILRELNWIGERLREGVSASDQARLEERREELRREARREAPEPREALEAELRRLEKAWKRLQRQRIDPVRQAGGGSSGGDFGFATDAILLNQQIDEAQGRDELEDRIRELRARLDEMDGDAAAGD